MILVVIVSWYFLTTFSSFICNYSPLDHVEVFSVFSALNSSQIISNPNTTLFWRIYMCCKRKLQHTCFHFWNFIKTFVEMPKITVDVNVNKSKCVKVGNADAVEGATLKQTANFFHLCYKIVKKYKHHYFIF